MDVLTDDHEREQVVRKWWHENWLSLTVGIVIAIALMIGYKQYQVYKNDKAAANAYEMSQIQTALVLKPTESIEKAQAFIKEHEDIYGSLLSLDLASTYIAQKDYDNTLVDSRSGLNMLQSEFNKLDEIVSEGVKKGKSIYSSASRYNE